MAASAVAPPKPRKWASQISPEVEWYLTTRGFDVTKIGTPQYRAEEPRKVKGAYFDPERVDRVITVMKSLTHTQGRWRGQPLEPTPYQVAHILAPIFGWVREDSTSGKVARITRTAWIETPRKSAKTTLCAALAVVLAFCDDEPGAQVVSGAASRDQARKAFDPVALIAKNSPLMKQAGIRTLRSRILRDSDGSYYEVASSAGDLLHGANIHGALVDEVHTHKSNSLIDALESGTGARSQPLVIFITTAGANKMGTPYAQKRDFVEKLCKRVIKDPSTYALVMAADAEMDPFAEKTWAIANPLYPETPSRSFLESEAAKAKQNPALRSRFLRLHLGVQTTEENRFVDLTVWDRNAGLIVPERLAGRKAYGGLDLASVSDLTSLCWSIPDDEGGIDNVWHHFLSERAYEQLVDRTAGSAEVWKREGHLIVTPGDVTDYEFIEAQIKKDMERYDVRLVGFDRWNSSATVTRLQQDNVPMVAVGQGFASMSPALKEINRLLLTGNTTSPKYRHGGNPVMRWMTQNLAVAQDASGNVKPAKDKSSDKIDGWSAAATAMSVLLSDAAEPAFVSAYESRSVDFI